MILGENIGQVYSSGTEIQKVYSYGKLVWEKEMIDYNTTAFTVEAVADNVSVQMSNTFKYSINGGEWFQSGSNNTIELNKSDIVNITSTNATKCSITGLSDIYGNIMSLIYGDNFIGQTVLPSAIYNFFSESDIQNAENLILPATTIPREGYAFMFNDCRSLITAPKTLPATTLGIYSYANMFKNCISLTTAPKLPATTLSDYCYERMFQNCTSLTQTPDLPATQLSHLCYGYMFLNCYSLTQTPEKLPATSLKEACYISMFQNCTSLTTAPELPASTLAYSCYSSMFYGCTSLTTAPKLTSSYLYYKCYSSMFYGCTNLNYVKCYAQRLHGSANSYTECIGGWLDGVSSTGTFVCLRGTDGGNNPLEDYIPSTWTVEYLN